MVEETFLKALSRHQLLRSRDKVILGVSGGPDSVCMLYLFSQIRDKFKLKLLCAHFNHCLREEAKSEEEFVEKICNQWKIDFVSEKKDVKKFFNGNSLEQTARNLRFDFFLKCARRYKFKKLALAHNKDDVIETILMRIIRGAALKGLRGISPKTKFKNIIIVRPLIEIRKKEILDWLKKKNIPYRVDRSNFEDKFFRNKIRLKLLPILEEFNPNIVNVLFTLAKATSLDYEFIYSFTKEQFAHLKKQRGKGYIRLNIDEIKKLPESIIVNLLRLAVEEVKGDTRRLTFRHFEQALELIHRKDSYGSLDLPLLEVKKEDRWLTIKSLLF